MAILATLLRSAASHGARLARLSLALGSCLMVSGWMPHPAYAGGGAGLVIAAIGDYGDGGEEAGSVAALVESWSPDVILTVGDNRYGSIPYDQAVGRFYCDYLKDAGSGHFCNGGHSAANAFFPVPGNHDYTDGGGIDEYEAYFTLPGDSVATSGSSGSERYYDFVAGPVHFFVVDSYGALEDAATMAAQKAWLQAQLAASTSRFQIVYMHHPPYSSSAKHGASSALRWDFAGWGAEAVLAGHAHNYERLEVAGIPYFVNGLGGKSIRKHHEPVANSEKWYDGGYGAMRITIQGEALRFEFFSLSGERVDIFTTGDAAPSTANG